MKDVGEISASVSNTMATKLSRVQIVITGEISMVSGLQLQTIDQRLRHIFNENLPFGGHSVLAFGDFHQLPWVMSAPVYSTHPTRSSNKFRGVFGQNLWEMFKVHRLTQIMRQSNRQFQTALNNLAKETLFQEDKSLFLSKTFPALTPEAVAARPVHLFARNDLLNSWNDQALDQIAGPDETAKASDVALGNGTKGAKDKATRNVRSLRPKDSMSLRTRLRLKVGARDMVTLNIDTSDGLVNRAIGTLMRVDHGVSKSTGISKPLQVWVKFNNDFVGARARLKMAGLMLTLNTDGFTSSVHFKIFTEVGLISIRCGFSCACVC
ncbi:hypothetical protein FOCC_FOCC007307 [Frankliniella occidentalis]|nr:hypothetical protein FOCC_FOCC007307 [Frankliniella occidentalis]